MAAGHRIPTCADRTGALIAALVAVCWFCLPAAAGTPPATTGAHDIAVQLKSHFRLALDKPVSRIAIGNPDVVDAKVTQRSEMVLLGKSLGRTSLILWMQGQTKPTEYAVVVTANTSGLKEAYGADPDLSAIDVEGAGKGAVLKGTVKSAEAHERAIRLAKAYVGTFVDDIVVLQRQMVSVEIRFAAMSASTLKRLGFNFSVFGRGFQAAVAGPSSVGSFGFTPGSGLSLSSNLPIRDAFNLFLSAPNVNFLSVLSALSGTQLAQVLAEPTLLVRSGESAEFISGGEIPVPVPQEQGAIGIQYRKFGIQLRLAATVLSPSRIAMRVSPQVSELDFSRAVTIGGTQVPAITTRGATTTIEIGDGQSFVLAGLMSSTQSNSEQQVPYLGDIPILGNFFKRVDNTRERQELVIIATPRLVNPVDAKKLPPLPGSDTRGYDPSIGDMLLNRNRLDDRLVRFGLMP